MVQAGGSRAARARWPGGAAWIGGGYCPVEEAKISVLDLGVTRSDATYDVVHVWRGRFYRLDDHLDRFAASCARLRLDPGHDRAGIEAILHGCVRATGLREAYVSMTCTRGRLAAGSRDLRTARCTFYCYAVPFVWVAAPGTGVSLWISEVTRIPPRSVDPRVKNYHWLDMDVAQLGAYDHGAQLAVLRQRPAPGHRGRHHLDRRRHHAGDPHRRPAGRHRHPRPQDHIAAGTVLGPPPRPPVLHPGPLPTLTATTAPASPRAAPQR